MLCKLSFVVGDHFGYSIWISELFLLKIGSGVVYFGGISCASVDWFGLIKTGPVQSGLVRFCYHKKLELKPDIGMLPDWTVCPCLVQMLPVYNRPRLFVDIVLHVPHPRAIEVGRTCTV
jgi:hypothetical protein